MIHIFLTGCVHILFLSCMLAILTNPCGTNCSAKKISLRVDRCSNMSEGKWNFSFLLKVEWGNDSPCCYSYLYLFHCFFFLFALLFLAVHFIYFLALFENTCSVTSNLLHTTSFPCKCILSGHCEKFKLLWQIFWPTICILYDDW